MSIDRRMLAMAATVARDNPEKFDNRSFCLGAVGLRSDGVIVAAKNISAKNIVPTHHAEARVVRKLTPNSIVWVARVLRSTGEWTLSRPCASCQGRMRSAGVEKVVYTIGPDEWGTIEL
jgi:tRNA(Arg) A34 adenosine deaminase TadA